FQQKCLDRMRVVSAQGTTIVFVSHDLATVEAICKRGVWLRDGVIEADGPVQESLAAYRNAIEETAASGANAAGKLRIRQVAVTGQALAAPATNQPLSISLLIDTAERHTGELFIGVSEGPATPIFSVRRKLTLDAGAHLVECEIGPVPLPGGRFYLW